VSNLRFEQQRLLLSVLRGIELNQTNVCRLPFIDVIGLEQAR